uniref:Probable proton-coupled zinc antiporter SLC30A3 n=1 Tax=Amphilophus citrinellus TaxID=61819 RepID=A0A3Q0RN44_AMPCI
MSGPEKTYSDSEFSEDVLSMEAIWQHEWLCQEADVMSGTERDTRCLARKKLFIACAVSLVFMTGELIEILGMFLSVMSIWAVTAVLVFSAVQRISSGDYEIDSQIMLITSGCAVGVNVLMVLILHQPGNSHGHSHGFATSLVQRDEQCQRRDHGSASVKAAFIHVVGDLLQSVGVLLAATIIRFWPEYKVADPICTFLFSLLVLGTALPVTKDVFRILLEGAPRGVSFGAVRELLLSAEGVSAVHGLHMWSLNMTHSLLSVHVVADADSQIILRKATKLLRSEFGFSSITIQVERCRISGSSAEVIS